jgi:AcrR family transcriptional regulator
VSNKAYERLGTDERRRQLLEVGSELFATRPYDEVWIDHVAERAGVSRGLVYHYFGSKRGFLHAVIEREVAQILSATEPDPQLAPAEQLRRGLGAYIAYVQQHPHGYRALFRGAPGADSTVRALVDANLEHQAERILLGVGEDPAKAPPMVRLAVRGWLSFVVATALDWLDAPDVGADALQELWIQTLFGSLSAAGSVAGRARTAAAAIRDAGGLPSLSDGCP